jgi:ribosomal protein S18 acetylase RimI-like enzyme
VNLEHAMPITLRPIHRNEHDTFLQRIVDTTWNDLPASHRTTFSAKEIAPNVERIVEVLMTQGDNVILVADTEAGSNVGQVWLGEAPDPYTGARRGYIYDLYVEQAMRGQGIGRALLEAAQAASRARGDLELGLTVAMHNESAQALYQALGFETERLTMSQHWKP